MNIYSTISQNKFKTWTIMILFVIFITTFVYILAKASGVSTLGIVGFALIISGAMSIGSYYYSDKMVLATTKSHPIQKSDNPELYNTIENLAIGSGMPIPKIYIMNEPSPNAFATGRDPKHAAIAVTTGLLERLNKAELEGVISHELSHIKNFDTRLMAITAILVGFIAILADMFTRNMIFGGFGRDNDSKDSRLQLIYVIFALILAILAPVVATLIQLAVSRKREFLADASGVLLTRYPEGLASALEKIAADPTPVRSASNATAHLFIENPFKKSNSAKTFASLFNTHPPIEERIKILRSM